MLKIVEAPQEVLSINAKEVRVPLDGVTLRFLKEMEETLLAAEDPKGVGLAAPQVGASSRIFIAKPTDRSKTLVFINPEILSITPIQKVKPKKGSTKKLEGCLSLKGIWGEVKRSPSLKLRYFDEYGISHTREFKGFMATIIQHETDHLNGVLFPKHVLEQKGKLYKSSKNEKGEDIFDEIKI
jgi:peptide deformylase